MYQPFPMWVTRDGESKLVQNEDELAALGVGWIVPEAPEVIAREDEPSYVEYPKWVNGQIVASAEEEDALTGNDTQSEREALIVIAGERGVKVDKRWSDARLREALDAK